jgi:hypothetical protein
VLHFDGLVKARAGNAQRVQGDVAFIQARNELAAHARGDALTHADDSTSDRSQRLRPGSAGQNFKAGGKPDLAARIRMFSFSEIFRSETARRRRE